MRVKVIHRKRDNAKWVLVIPPNIVEELKWKEGQKLGAETKENTPIVKKNYFFCSEHQTFTFQLRI